MGNETSSPAAAEPDAGERALLQHLEHVHAWHETFDGNDALIGKVIAQYVAPKQAEFVVRPEALGDAFLPYAAFQRSDTLSTELMEDIAKLALAVPEMKFSAELRKQMFVIAQIHHCMRAQAQRFRSERRAALEFAQEQRKRLSPGDNRSSMTKAQKLAMKYAVRMILLLVRSVQKVEGQLFLDVLNMASSLLQNIPALALANSKSFPPEAADCLVPLLEFLDEVVQSDECGDQEKRLAIRVLLRLGLIRGSVKGVLSGAIAMLQLAPTIPSLPPDVLRPLHDLAAQKPQFTEEREETEKTESGFGVANWTTFDGSGRTFLRSLVDKAGEDNSQSIETKRAALMVLAHLDCLSEHLAPAESTSINGFGEQKSMARLNEPLAVEVVPGTLSSLWSIAEHALKRLRQQKQKHQPEAQFEDSEQDEFLLNANMLTLALRLMKVHVYQMSLASLDLSNESEPSFAASCRQMLFQLAGHSFTCSDKLVSERVSAVIQHEALNILAHGFEVFFPAVHEQASYITSLLKRREPKSHRQQLERNENQPVSGEANLLSPVEKKLLKMLLRRLTSARAVSTLNEDLRASADTKEQAKEASITALLAILRQDCIDEALDWVQGFSNKKPEIGEVASSTHMVHLMQMHLLSRAAVLLRKLGNGGDTQQRQHRLAFLVSSVSKHAVQMARGAISIIDAALERLSNLNERADMVELGEQLLGHSMLTTLVWPLLMSLCSLSPADRALLAVPLSTTTGELLQSVNRLRALVLTVKPKTRVTKKRKVIECTAPPQTPSLGQACTSTKHELNFVGASSIDFTIESSVNTAVELEIFSGSGPNKVLVSRFSAESYASARTPVRVMGASATVEYWTVVASTASPREGVGRGCSLLAEANIKHRPLHWVHAFARTVSWLCGQLAGALLNGTDDDESEELCRDWIQSGLFNGSFESYSQYATLRTEALRNAAVPLSTSSEFSISLPPGNEESEFLQEIISNVRNGAALINRLERVVRSVFAVPASLRNLAHCSTRFVFAAMLKHTNRVEQALLNSLEDNRSRPDEGLVRIFRRAQEVQSWLAVQFGQGHRREDLEERALDRCRLLLEFAPASTSIAPLSLTRQASGSMSAQQPLLLRSNSRSSPTVHRTLRAMRLLRDDLYLMKSNSGGSLQQQQQHHHHQHQHQSTGGDADAKMCRLVLAWIQEPSIACSRLVSAVVAQRCRAAVRLCGLDEFAHMLSSVREHDLRIEIVRHLGEALHRRLDSGSDTRSVRRHFLGGTEAAGRHVRDQLLAKYYSLVASLHRNASLDDNKLLLALNLFNVEFSEHDVEYLHKIGVVKFFAPLLVFDGKPEGESAVCTRQWNVRYGAWALFRLLAYVCARATHNDDAVAKLQHSILEFLLSETRKLQALRHRRVEESEAAKVASATATDTTCLPCSNEIELEEQSGWLCKLCTFINDNSFNSCQMCTTLRSGAKAPSMWACQACTFLNAPDAQCCIICDKPAGSGSGDELALLPTLSTPTPDGLGNGPERVTETRSSGSSCSTVPDGENAGLFWETSSPASVSLCGPDPSEPVSVTICGNENSAIWHNVVTSQAQPLKFSVRIEQLSKDAELLVGIVPWDSTGDTHSIDDRFDAVDGWSYSSQSGVKTHSGSASEYGETFGIGDVIGVELHDGTLEFSKNGVSQGVAFSGLAMSTDNIRGVLAGRGEKVTAALVRNDAYMEQSRDWEARLRNARLVHASVGWFACDHADLGACGKRLRRRELASEPEIDLVLNQLLWLLCRCSAAESFRVSLCTTQWIATVLQIITTPSSSPISRTLALRICRSVFPQVSPRADLFAAVNSSSAATQEPAAPHFIAFALDQIGGVCFSYAHSASPPDTAEFARQLWVASETVALLRVLWLSDKWMDELSASLSVSMHTLGPLLEFIEAHEGERAPALFCRSLGALAVLGAFVEPLREGARVQFQRDGRLEEGIVLEFSGAESAFRLVVRPDGEAENTLELTSEAQANSMQMLAVAEVDVLPEVLGSRPDLVVSVARHLLHIHAVTNSAPFIESKDSNLANESAVSQKAMFAQVGFMCARVLVHALDNAACSEALDAAELLQPIVALAVRSSSLPTDVRIDNLETCSLGLLALRVQNRIELQPPGPFVPDGKNSLPEVGSTAHIKLFEKDMEDDKSLASASSLDSGINAVSKDMMTVSLDWSSRRRVPLQGGQIMPFGKGDNGRLGFGDNTSVTVPKVLDGFGGTKLIVMVSCFSSHVMALSSDGVPYSWGKGDDGRLGHGGRSPESSPRAIAALEGTTCVQVSAGLNFSVVLDESGALWAFGSNANGQVGAGSFATHLVPVRVKGELESKKVVRVAAGGSHVLAIALGGDLYSWGKNQYGQLGHGCDTKLNLPKLVEAARGRIFVLVSGGWEHSMAVTSQGALYTWGAGYEGTRPVCGHGSNQRELEPREVDVMRGKVVIHIAAGWDHSMAITNDGQLYTWGSGNSGMLGHGNTNSVNTPQPVGGKLSGERCVWVDGGQDHTAVVTAKGNLYTFGAGGAHLGLEGTTQLREPHLVENLSGNHIVSMVAVGDKCTYPLTSVNPRSLPSKPLSDFDGRISLPLYPTCAYLTSGSSSLCFDEAEGCNGLRDLVSNKSARLSGPLSAINSIGVEEIAYLKLTRQNSIELDLEPTGPFTMSAAFRFQSESFDATAANEEEDENLEAVLFRLNCGKIALNVLRCSSETIEMSILPFARRRVRCNFSDQQWHVISVVCCISRQTEYTLSVFVDDVDVFSQTILTSGGSRVMRIGPLRGSVRQLAVWDVALSQSEIRGLIANGLNFVDVDFHFDQIQRNLWQLVDLSTYDGTLRSDGGRGKLVPCSAPLCWTSPWKREIKQYTMICDVRLPATSTGDILLISFPLAESLELILKPDNVLSLGLHMSTSHPIPREQFCRLALVVDTVHKQKLSMFVNGISVASLPVVDGVQLHQSLMLFGGLLEVTLRSLQFFDRALSPDEIKEFGSAKQSVYWSGTVVATATSLQQMGFPWRWVCRALRACSLNRLKASRWILSHQNELREYDREAKLREGASCLSWTGYSRSKCLRALARHGGDYRRAITELFQQSCVSSVDEGDEDETVDKDGVDDAVADVSTQLHCLDENGVNSNPAYHILDSCSEPMRTTLGAMRAPSVSARRILPPPELGSSGGSGASSTALSPIDLSERLTVLHQQLRVLHSRHAVLALIQQQQSPAPVSLQQVLTPAFLSHMIRLFSYSRLPGALHVLREHVFQRLVLEGENWSQADAESRSLPVHAPLASRLIVECLQHMIGTCLRSSFSSASPSSFSSSSITSEEEALTQPNAEIALWILELLIHLKSNGSVEESFASQILCPPLVNLIFEMVVVTRSECRLAFLLMLSHLVRERVPFLPHKPALLRRHMFALYDRYKDNGLFSGFFQALLELVVSIDETTSPNISTETRPPWYDEFLQLQRFLGILVERSSNSTTEYPSKFGTEVLQQIRGWNQQDFELEPSEFYDINVQFDFASDCALIACVDRQYGTAAAESSGINNSGSGGIEPVDVDASTFTPSPNQLVQYETLRHRPLRHLRVRFKVLQTFNKLVASVLPLVNVSRSDAESKLARLVRAARGLIFWSTKSKLWHEVLSRTNSGSSSSVASLSSSHDLRVTIDRFAAAKLQERGRVDVKGRKSVFGQTFRQVNSVAPRLLRLRRDERAWKVVFVGEHSDDYGGPYRNCLDAICAELQSPMLPLFVPCPNQKSKIGFNQDKYVPRPSTNLPHQLAMFEFVGKLMGIAIRTRNLLNLDLPTIIWKSIVQEPITRADVVAIDAVAFRVLTHIRRVECDLSISSDMFEEVLCLNFMVTSSAGDEVELVPGGADQPVTFCNRKQFERLLVDYRLGEFSEACEAMRRGLATIVPFALLSLFTAEELELQVCGRPRMNVGLLKSMTTYEWCSENDPHILYFWEVLEKHFDDHERALLLKFVWGRSRLPLHASEFECKFKISNMPKARQDPDRYLPISHTCFFSIELPRYTSVDVMHQRVLYAITHCVSIDADSTSAAQSAARTHSIADDDIDDDDEEEEDVMAVSPDGQIDEDGTIMIVDDEDSEEKEFDDPLCS